MDTLRHAFRINVGFLISAEIGYFRDFDFQIEKYRDDDLILLDLEGIIKGSRTQQGIFFEGKLFAKVELTCSRCLENYWQPISIKFEELYAFSEDQITESELIIPDNAQIELSELVREYAILAFPIQPKCAEECKGLCVVCGVDLNKEDCGHRSEPDNAFSKLLDLIDKTEDN